MRLVANIAGLALLALMCSSGSAAAQTPKIQVSVDATSSDLAGQQFVYELREALGRSSHLTAAATEDDSLFQLKVVTLDPYSHLPGSAQTSTVYSVVMTGQNLSGGSGKIFIDQWVGTCSGALVSQCASRILASADADMMPIIEAIRASLRKTSPGH